MKADLLKIHYPLQSELHLKELFEQYILLGPKEIDRKGTVEVEYREFEMENKRSEIKTLAKAYYH